MIVPKQPKRPVGRPPLATEARRTGRLPFRVLPDVAEKAKRLGRARIEKIIREAAE